TVYRPKYGDADPLPVASTDHVYDFKNFGEFLLTFAAVCSSLREPQDYVRILREYAQDARTHNVMYAELFVSPSVWRFFHPELNVTLTFEALWAEAQAIAAAGGPEIRFICDLTRNFGVEGAMETARTAALLQDCGIIGIGLGGDEAKFPAAWFAESFNFARSEGLHTVAHAGEAAGAASVHAAVEILRAERIGHGIRALEDRSVVELLVRRGIPLEICPTSNYKTGVVPPDAPHPLAALDAAGVKIVLDSDDPTLFKTDVTAEYVRAESLVGFDAVLRYARNAIDVSFADAAAKASMTARFEAACAELLPTRRS
ncbi:MAG: adenosine deaminase, partial [Candidatus Eremiobacteraeota bacterium]|nr:adenosine deaminase [Candidatus Eremiobacteraeota bacterium]